MSKLITTTPQSRFGDLIISWEGELDDPLPIFSFIDSNLQSYKEADVPSLWVTLSDKALDHLSAFLAYGFKIHQAKSANSLSLNLWLRTTSFTLPPAPFGYFGAGAFVVNSQSKVLFVRENYKSGPGPWKFPGGLYDPSKDSKLSDAAVRECFEETGIKARFDAVLCSRFISQGGLFSAPDLYTISRLIPETEEISYDKVEIADCQWLDPEEVMKDAHPMVKEFLLACLAAKDGIEEKDIGFKSNIYFAK